MASYMWFFGEFLMTETNSNRDLLYGLLYMVFWRVRNDRFLASFVCIDGELLINVMWALICGFLESLQ
jgi:hypothetical protein